jgi:mercuric ion transport protein
MKIPGPSRALTGGLLAAVGASVCCVLPLALLGLGVGGAWVANLTALEPARPIFVVLAIGFLALAFRGLYLAPARCEPGDACADGSVRRRQRAIFWLASIVVVGLLAAPWAASFIV